MLLRICIGGLLAAALAAAPDSLALIHEKRAEYFRLSLIQVQVAMRIQELRGEIQADVKAAGCTIDEKLERLECKK